jgi:hypothetical protein
MNTTALIWVGFAATTAAQLAILLYLELDYRRSQRWLKQQREQNARRIGR